MTTTEKIEQLQKEVELLRKLALSNEDAIIAQLQVINNLHQQIDQHQSFIRSKNLY